MAPFRILNCEDPLWQDYYLRLPQDQRDIFYSPGYAHAFQAIQRQGARVHCAVYENGNSFILYPFMERQLYSLVPDGGINNAYRDATGIYGRNGIVHSGADGDIFIEFRDSLFDYFHQRQVICGFDRFHPVIENNAFCFDKKGVINIGQFVVADLRPSMDDIFGNFKYSQRKSINKARRFGVEIFHETNLDHLDKFLSIYASTLDRREAGSAYYFERSFYESLEKHIPGNFCFFYAVFEGTIISCELVLREGVYGHSFLGGTLSAYMEKCPNPLLKLELMRHLKSIGCHYYLLGGGQKPDDGVYKYKLSFAPDGAMPSYVGGTIYCPDAYSGLRESLANSTVKIQQNRFQFYDHGL